MCFNSVPKIWENSALLLILRVLYLENNRYRMVRRFTWDTIKQSVCQLLSETRSSLSQTAGRQVLERIRSEIQWILPQMVVFLPNLAHKQGSKQDKSKTQFLPNQSLMSHWHVFPYVLTLQMCFVTEMTHIQSCNIWKHLEMSKILKWRLWEIVILDRWAKRDW